MSFQLEPNQHYEGLEIKDNPLFNARAPRHAVSKAERIFATVLYSAEKCVAQGFAVTAETIRMFNSELTIKDVTDLLASSRMQAAMADRGIPLPSATGLAPEQLAALAIYTDMSIPADHATRLDLMGVTAAKWRGWLRQPRFAAELSMLSEENLKNSKDTALQRVAEAADAGQRWAVELVFEMTGRHDRRKETVDVNQLLMDIFTVLDEEIADVRVLQTISDRIKQRLGAGAAPVLTITANGVKPLDQLEQGADDLSLTT